MVALVLLGTLPRHILCALASL
eukprot:COSAG01_NODE_43243_length_431_cov_11.356604_1_plen_21_part_01